MYFLAENIINLLVIYTSLLLLVLSNGYSINLPARSIHSCRFNIYSGFVWDILGPFYLILASVDRVLVTSRNAVTRRRSNRQLAYICIISGTIFWMLFHVHALILSSVVEVAPNYFLCYFSSKTYLQVTSFYSLIVKAILVPVLMSILGIWAIRNVRGIGRMRAAPDLSSVRTGGAVNAIHSKDRQLVQILLINVSVYMICNVMLTATLMYQTITENRVKSSLQTTIDIFLLFLSLFSSYVYNCCGCYINLFVSKTFRKELRSILLCK